MIKSIEFKGKSYNLFPDVNVVIGKNGIGKTSFLEHITQTYSGVYMFERKELLNEGRERSSASHNLIIMLDAVSTHSDCDVILIDDIELYQDVDTQRVLIRQIKGLIPNTQLVCTTTSPCCLRPWINKAINLEE